MHINTNNVWRGGEQQIHYLLNNTSKNFDAHLFCVENSELHKRNAVKKEKVFTFKKRFGADVSSAFTLKTLCNKINIDLVHLHDSHAINIYIAAAWLGLQTPAIIHRRVNLAISNKRKYTHKQIQKIICLSEAVKKKFSFVKEEKLVVIPPAINLSKFSTTTTNTIKTDLNLPKNAVLIGIAAALEKEKNIEEFIKIAQAAILKNDLYHFLLIGDGSLYKTYSTKYATKNIHFLGFRNDIPQIINELDIFLFTSKNEGYGQVLLEAMASKVPIVSSNFPVVTEIIQQGKNGFIYTTIEEAVEKIEYLSNHTKEKNAIINNAHKFVQQFDVALVNKQIEAIYTSVLSI